tara:strand:- start:2883 stop:3548 length:666 start_codon:yes stop_codon:yes gene_type:complete
MNEIQLTGGAKIGMINCSIPFATLSISENELQLTTTFGANLIFQTEDIVSIKEYTVLPIIGQGIRIEHKVSEYKEDVVFWTMKKPAEVIREIQRVGFLNNKPHEQNTPIRRQKSIGFPVKLPFVIGLFGLWNLLFLLGVIDMFNEKAFFLPKGDAILASLVLIFFTSLFTLVSPFFRKLILKEGAVYREVKKMALFILFISVVMLVVFGFFFNLEDFALSP